MAEVSRFEVDIADKRFPAPAGGRRTVLHDVAFRMHARELAVVLGPSGCGKTTLLNIVAGLDRDFTGSVRLGGKPPDAARIGYVFQSPRLLPWRTVSENVALALPSAVDRACVPRLIAEVGLSEFADAYPTQLSLGMARRVSLARAFAVEPELLLMDEPFVSIDEPTALRLRQQLLALWSSRPTAVLFVTHSTREAAEIADRILILSSAPGRLIADIDVPLARERRADLAEIDRICRNIEARVATP
jgi:ABC-type nitrate/sulfonate/bicarbonate transport system ATPase subunit